MKSVKKRASISIINILKDQDKNNLLHDNKKLNVHSTEEYRNASTDQAVFTPKKQSKKNSLKTRPVYSERDIKINLINISIPEKSRHIKNKISGFYLKKAAIWSALITSSTIAVGSINILTSKILDLAMQGNVILGISATAVIAGYHHLWHKSKTLKKQHDIYNTTMSFTDSSSLLTALTNNLCLLFSVKPLPIIFTLKPEVKISIADRQPFLNIGLPLLHTLSFKELTALISFHLECFRNIKNRNIFPIFNNETIQIFEASAQQPLLDIFLNTATKSLKKEITTKSVTTAAHITDMTTLINAFHKQELLKFSFNESIQSLKNDDIMPINIITQILCANESIEAQNAIKNLLIEDTFRAHTLYSQNYHPEKSHACNIYQDFPASLLVDNINTFADKISMETLKKLGFHQEQLEKTHEAHKAFAETESLDPLKRYNLNIYRINRAITPNIFENKTGSLLTLKIDINTLNKQLKPYIKKCQSIIHTWDESLSPYSTKNRVDTNQAINLEKTHLELQEIEALLGRKTGLCIDFILSIGSPQEQNTVYLLLNAHRKALNILRACDQVIESLAAFRQTQNRDLLLSVIKHAKTLAGLCTGLPALEESGIDIAVNAKYIQTMLNSTDDSGEICQNILQFITVIEDYKWQTDLQLILICERVEERLGIS